MADIDEMEIMWMFDTKKPIKQRPDGSYVVTYNGSEYHVTEDDDYAPEGLWDNVTKWAAENPAAVEEDRNDIPLYAAGEVPREDQIKTELAALDQKLIRPLSEVALGTETPSDVAIIEDVKAQKEKLRAELAALKQGGQNE